MSDTPQLNPDRRQALAALAALGVGTAGFQRALAATVAAPDELAPLPRPVGVRAVTPKMVEQAEWVAGITLTPEERVAVARSLTRSQAALDAARPMPLANSTGPAFAFRPLEGVNPLRDAADALPAGPAPFAMDRRARERPADDDLAFSSLYELQALMTAKVVSSVELTKLFLARLRRYGPGLECVVHITEELALKQARRADDERAVGKVRSPLHGIPWGAKDILAVPDTETTWGAFHYVDQFLPDTAAVCARLEAAGCVLVAKLTTGTLALGDRWHGGTTRNPWNPKQGSSGSSAGPASAASAGLVPFAIGSETLGSIMSPSARCATTGLRPTFGRVSRAGAMCLCPTMDKLGPMGRNVADMAVVLREIHGADPADPSSVTRPFRWPHGLKDGEKLRVGVGATRGADGLIPEVAKALAAKHKQVELVPVKVPSGPKVSAMIAILDAECAATFDDLTRLGVSEGIGSWATPFRAGQFVSAVDYIRAQRLRTELMREMEDAIKGVDCYLGGDDLVLTNFTGHPSVSLPYGMRTANGADTQPYQVTLTGRLFGESDLLAVAAMVEGVNPKRGARPDLTKVPKEAQKS